jgi:hypothetical protein
MRSLDCLSFSLTDGFVTLSKRKPDAEPEVAVARRPSLIRQMMYVNLVKFENNEMHQNNFVTCEFLTVTKQQRNLDKTSQNCQCSTLSVKQGYVIDVLYSF